MADKEASDEMCVHVWSVCVCYNDTDAGSVVYHMSYLCFVERVRTELIRTFGIESSRFLVGKEGSLVLFQVYHLEIEYLGAVRLDDVIVAHTHLAAVGGASFTFAYTLRGGVSSPEWGLWLPACATTWADRLVCRRYCGIDESHTSTRTEQPWRRNSWI